ncbi:MAG TPA: NADP-dependent oxidoreductase [Alphaproteobacteria bacterium]
MRAVVLREYGTAGQSLRIESDYPDPKPGPGQVLVGVKASSVNPIDVRMSGGYARARLKSLGITPPMVLGRDVAGTVEALGTGVDRFKIGDPVWGLVVSSEPGALAELVAVRAELLVPKPPSVSWHEAATLPYAGLTTWSAFVNDAGLRPGGLAGKLALVLGGAGGTGSFAVQLLKLWGAKVAATCSTRNVEFVAGCGAEMVVDYTRDDFTRVLRDVDVVYDTVGGDDDRALSVLRSGAGATFVSIVHPVIPITDELGWDEGIKRVNAIRQAKAEEQRAKFDRFYSWAMIKPDNAMLAAATKLFTERKIRMSIEKVYKLDQIREAFAHSATNRVRGKLIVEID